MRKILALLLAVMMLLTFVACSESDVIDALETAEAFAEVLSEVTEEDLADAFPSLESTTNTNLEEDGFYYSAEDVSAYLYTYGELPDNFITKEEAKALGWEGGSVEKYAPGHAIGGDRFGNREGLLPEDEIYYECDIDTDGQDSRGAKRLVFSDDLIYYTQDHYESFVLLYGEE